MGTITRDRPKILAALEVHPILISSFMLLVININLLAHQKKKPARPQAGKQKRKFDDDHNNMTFYVNTNLKAALRGIDCLAD